MRSPLQLWREWRCPNRRWAKQGALPNQLHTNDVIGWRNARIVELAQYWPCVVCRVERYYHEPADHRYVEMPGLLRTTLETGRNVLLGRVQGLPFALGDGRVAWFCPVCTHHLFEPHCHITLPPRVPRDTTP